MFGQPNNTLTTTSISSYDCIL